MNVWRVLALACLLMGSGLFTRTAEAVIRPFSFYFHPHGGIYDFHDDQAQEDAPVYGLGIGYRFSREWSSEIDFSFVDSKEKEVANDSIENYLLRWEFLYHFRPQERLVPFLSAGVGGLLSDQPGGDTDLDALVGYGLGIEAFLTESIALRLDGRHFLTASNIRFDGKEYQNFTASAGLVLQVGGEEEKPQVIDTDGDGVIDSFDRCPNTRLGVPVDGYGCPADADRDGVPDHQDKCPDTPAGLPLDRNGCPPDDDGDGVPDFLDQCPDTARGVQVDGAGCPAPAAPHQGTVPKVQDAPAAPVADNAAGQPPATSLTVQLEFAPGRADLDSEDQRRLQIAVEFLRAHPGKAIVVEGHTDSVGSEEINLRLSQARAEKVRRYLIDATGVIPERVQARGYGESRPVADNATQEGRQQNRRVVIRLVE